ncbi:hypothetical protein PPYR_11021 [Photinus pyralis]|uniref:Uncharacterized protein n=1 Tax=Photinus pyralis TaxID=7054 RepID=A0A1Y1KJY2_PHOPY|nr:uncharacterized protein LOC116173833 [Photinus pyralis]KAB0796960.1 hypothetical protein PPYR_11021 [Photinus pyralis]
MQSMADKRLKLNNGKEEGEPSESLSRKLTSSPTFPYSLPDDVDVVWNWYSPTSQPQYFKPKVKVQQSPKILVKRHPSREQITAFNKLVEELKTFTNPNTVQEELDRDYADVFDDSLDEELLIISQKVEQSVSQKVPAHSDISNDSLGNDSFDCALASIKDEDLNLQKEQKTSKTQLTTSLKEDQPIKCSAEEIEQKRLQALARLEAKKMQNNIERNRQEALKRLALTRKRKLLQ